MGILLEKSLNFNRKVKINFEGGDLISDAGLLLYKEFDKKIGLSTTIEDNLNVKDDAKFRYPSISRFIRTDSGFANPHLYELIEENNAFYAIRLKANKTLYTKAESITERM